MSAPEITFGAFDEPGATTIGRAHWSCGDAIWRATPKAAKVLVAQPRDRRVLLKTLKKNPWAPVLPFMFGPVAGFATAVASAAVVGAEHVVRSPRRLRGWDEHLEFAEWPLLLGSESMVTYRLRPHRPQDLPDVSAKFQLRCEEGLCYEKGSLREAETEIVFDEVQFNPGSAGPGGLEATVLLRLPMHSGAPTMNSGGPTRTSGSHTVRWTLQVTANGPGLPGVASTFDLTILPRIDQRFGQRLQDT